MKNLYEITGSIADINTLLVNKAEYEELHRDAAQASKLRDAVKFLLGTTVPATGQQEQCWIVLTDAMKEST